MLFSIITGTHNNAATIDRAIQSVVKQTEVSWELIVVNDGSTDDTAARVQRWTRVDARIVLLDQPASGVSAARNHALQVAQGDYVLFLDADDWFEPDSLKQLAPVLAAQNADILIFNCYDATSESQHQRSLAFSEEADWTRPEELARINRYCATQHGETWDVWYGNLHNVWGRCFRRQLIEQFAVRFDEQLTVSEDWAFNLNLFPHARKVSIRDVYLYNYFNNVHSVMHQYQWPGHQQFMVSYHHLAAVIQQLDATDDILPYVAVDQLREEFRLIAKAGLGPLRGTRAVFAILVSPECQWVVKTVDHQRLRRHDRVIYGLLQRRRAGWVWLIYYYQMCVKPRITVHRH
ncbi:glycosyltransferase family 2 protein [Lacticaseibacillus sp. GG6-2]